MSEETQEVLPEVLPSLEELTKEVQMHRQVLQGMALHLQQLNARVEELLEFDSFLMETLGGDYATPGA